MAAVLSLVVPVAISLISISSMNILCFGFSESAVTICKVGFQTTKFPPRMRLFSKLDDFMEEVESLLESPVSQEATMKATNKGWQDLNLSGLAIRETKPSVVEDKLIQGRRVYIKRDDMLRLHGSQIAGNKARKMLAMNEVPARDFPECLVSFGGPQSNSMLALAALVNYKNREAEAEMEESRSIVEPSSMKNNTMLPGQTKKKRFVYYTKKLPRFLRNQPSGNLFRAKTLGMEIKELSQQEYGDIFGGDNGGSPTPPLGLCPPVVGGSLWVPQGGAFRMASVGTAVLAREVVSFWMQSGHGRSLSVCLPGGTCATAVLLHNELKRLQEGLQDSLDIEVVVIPCVGNAGYARRQMMALNAEIGAEIEDVPAILQPGPDPHKKDDRYFPFGQPHESILQTFKMMEEDHGVVLDLIYGAPAWTVLLRHWNVTLGPDLSFDPNNPVAGREVLYIHCGGQEGINSQLLRYKYKGLVTTRDIQLPGRRSK